MELGDTFQRFDCRANIGLGKILRGFFFFFLKGERRERRDKVKVEGSKVGDSESTGNSCSVIPRLNTIGLTCQVFRTIDDEYSRNYFESCQRFLQRCISSV